MIVMKALDDSAKVLRSGDHVVLTYSGHGGQVPDQNGDETEDKKDETWVLYDRQLIDDELYTMLGKFEQDVRILVLSDSCHSGTVTRVATYKRLILNLLPDTNNKTKSDTMKFRAMPIDIQNKTYEKDKNYYSKIQKSFRSGERVAVGACVLLISGCQDNQLSADGDRNGAFTGALRKVWNGGQFKGGHSKFQKEISDMLPPTQSPNYFKVGFKDIQFERMKPFTIG
jgi:metacaspase-1